MPRAELHRIRHARAMLASRAGAPLRVTRRCPALDAAFTMIDRRQLGLGDVQKLPPRGCTHPETRRVDEPIVREMLRAMGVVTCERCHETLRIHGRRMARELPRRH
jgi:hypothetical protein